MIEYDRALAAYLRERYAGDPVVDVVEADVLSSPLAALASTDDFLLAGNVPYYITTPILFHALEPPRPRRSVFLVQREVAARLGASPGGSDYGALSVNVQAVATVERLFQVPPGAFRPPPRVHSAVVRIEPRSDPIITTGEAASFRRLVQSAFGFRRKQMRRIIRSLYNVSPDESERLLRDSHIDPQARPETLAPSAFVSLLRVAGAVNRDS